eukprot:SAG11_NODE_2314_length_3534_cov_2.787773_5_plen_57_part_00
MRVVGDRCGRQLTHCLRTIAASLGREANRVQHRTLQLDLERQIRSHQPGKGLRAGD